MKKPYKVMKFIACPLGGENRRRSAIGQMCGDVWLYSEAIPKPECEKCSLFIEAAMKKQRLKKEKGMARELEPAIKELGFKDKEEFHRLICEVDISMPWKMARFKTWQFTDGSKTGLLEVIRLNKEKK